MVRLPTLLRHAAPPAFEFVVEDPHAHLSPRAQHLIASDPLYEATAKRLKAYKFRPAVEPASSSCPVSSTPPFEHFFFTPADSLVAYGEMHPEEKLERFKAAVREVDEAEGQLVDVLSGRSRGKVCWAKAKRAIARAPVRYRLDFASLSRSASSRAPLSSRTTPPSTRAPSTLARTSPSTVSRRKRPSLFTFRSASSSTSSTSTAVDSLFSASFRSTHATDPNAGSCSSARDGGIESFRRREEAVWFSSSALLS
ncbi:hypothetical protein JCM10213_007747 [Rhodosporidiobolus nylandii]